MLPHPKAQCSATRIRRSQVPSRHASRARLRVGPIATPLLSVSATCHTETPFHLFQTQPLRYRPVNCRPLPAMMTSLKRRALLRASGPPAPPLHPHHSIEAARKHRIHSPRSQRHRRLRRAPLLLSRPRAPKRDISIHSRDPRRFPSRIRKTLSRRLGNHRTWPSTIDSASSKVRRRPSPKMPRPTTRPRCHPRHIPSPWPRLSRTRTLPEAERRCSIGAISNARARQRLAAAASVRTAVSRAAAMPCVRSRSAKPGTR